MMLKAILFDLGDTLIYESVDKIYRLDEMTLHIRPHVRDILNYLSRHYKIGLVSDTETSPESSVRAALRNLKIESFFSAVVTSVDVGVRKPHPKIFLEALHRLEVTPSEAIMIGNDPQSDIVGAKRLGMIAILCRSSDYYRKGAEEDADYFVDSLDEIPDIISSITNSKDTAE